MAPGKATLLFEQRSFDLFAFKHEGDEHGFAGTVLIRRQPREAVAAIDKFFNGELQARILFWKPEGWMKRIAACRFPIGNCKSEIVRQHFTCRTDSASAAHIFPATVCVRIASAVAQFVLTAFCGGTAPVPDRPRPARSRPVHPVSPPLEPRTVSLLLR